VKLSQSGWVLCCILSIATFAFGQTATTSLRGTVKDSSGALVPGANVALSDTATDNTYHAASNSSGFYIFPVLNPAHYLITISSGGFATQTRTAELLVDQPATVDFTLSVQAATVTVDVSTTTETLNFTDATMGASVGNTTIEALPMDGRNPISLLTLQPGVLYIGGINTDSRQGAVAGGRSDQGNILLDGLDDNDQVYGTAFTGILRSTLDSTEEFRVTTSNGTAASGRSSGAQINLITKSGSNTRHGSLYEYYRPTNTVANQFFNKYDQLTSTPPEPNIPQKYIQNVFGGSTGGPVKRDKLFYFFNYEGQRVGTDQVVGATVPTTNFAAGQLGYLDTENNPETLTAPQVIALDAPCMTGSYEGMPACPAGPGANQAVLSYYASAKVPTVMPQPPGTTPLGDGINSGALFFTSPAPSTLNTSIVKIDYNLNSKNRLFVRGNLQKDTAAGAENFPGQPPQTYYDDNTKGISAGHTWTPTDHIVNDLRYGYIRQGYQSGGIAPGEWVDIAGLTQPTAQTSSSYLHVPVNNITDTLSWNKGTHTFAFGGNWRGISNQHGANGNSFDGASTNPLYAEGNPPTPADMSGGFYSPWIYAYTDLMGIVPEVVDTYNYAITSTTEGTALPEGSVIARDFHSNEFEYYVQDTWHARRNLNVTLGVRHTILQTPYEVHGQQESPNIDTDAWYKMREAAALQSQVYEPIISLTPSGKANGQPAYWPKQKHNLAPRIGVAWAPDAKTSIRASAGMYFDHYGEALVNSFDAVGSLGLGYFITNTPDEVGFEDAPRFTGPHNIPNISLPPFAPTQSFPYTPPVENFGINWGMDNRIKTPYAESYNVSFQHELPAGFTFEEAYVGRFGRHLLQQLDLAEPVDYVDPGGAGDYFSNARILSKEVDAAPFGTEQYGIFAGNTQKVNNNVPAIPYFEHVFPYMANQDYEGESATQAIFNNAWAPERYSNGETLALAICDVFGIFPGSPNYSEGSPTSTFWTDQFSSLYSQASIGTSSYNALQFTLRHPSSHGLTVDVGYTFSKSIDLASETERANQINPGGDDAFTNTAIQNTWNPKLNKGPSDFDTHSLFTTDWVYALPVGRGKAALGNANAVAEALIGGWQWAGLARWTSGLPFTLESPAYPTNYNNPGMAIQTAPFKVKRQFLSGIPHVIDPATATSINNGIYFGGPLIRLPYAGEAGQRNNFRGDGYMAIDSSVTKTWKIAELAELKLAAEVYNITNSNRFDTSPAGLGAGTANSNLGVYGVPLSTYRRMQFGLRAQF